MGANLIKKGIEQITASRLNTIHMEYNVDCVTFNVITLHKELKKAIKSKRVMVIKGKREVDPDEVFDMFNSLDSAVKFYKVKYNRRTFPKDINLFQLINDISELKPEEIVRKALNLDNVTKTNRNGKKKIDFDKLIENEFKMGTL